MNSHKDKQNTIQALITLVRAGLWDKEVHLSQYEPIDFNYLYNLAQQQSVVGLVAAGMDHVTDVRPPKEVVLTFVGESLHWEQRNTAMNFFIGVIVDKMRNAGIQTILVKGQGIAQCYEHPLWRACGDVDFFLSKDNYIKANDYIGSLASSSKPERHYSKEVGYYLDPWLVELHGTLRTGLSARVDKTIDQVQYDMFCAESYREWMVGTTQVFLPAINDDVFLVFTHFIKHFYKEGGMSLKQVCDWCRLLWKFKNEVDIALLEQRLKQAGLKKEWKSFAALAVKYLGMPVEAIPMYDEDEKWEKKARKILSFILRGGEWHRVKDTISILTIFPLNTFRFLPSLLFNVNFLKIKEIIFHKT